ncbi:hypothetical protein AWZ03_010376 [Drosophila navojoa]|uniref:Uncharacterized protein n=1 Tax=Drosophila navojoa TaxID=7232 RepID=A0A484B323_DRONA|nr:hypothetical protein AWZ03_010376 [Drosophila navojoa]
MKVVLELSKDSRQFRRMYITSSTCVPEPISGQQQQQQLQQQLALQQTQQTQQQLQLQRQQQQQVQQQLLAQQQQQLQIQQLQQQLLLQRLERELQQQQHQQQLAQQQQQILYHQRQHYGRHRWLSGSNHYNYTPLHQHQQQHHHHQQQQQQQQYSYYFSRGSSSSSGLGLGLGLGLGFGLGGSNLASWYHLPSTSAHIYIGSSSTGGAPYPYRLGYSGGGYPAAALINFETSPTPLLSSTGSSPGYLPPLPAPALPPPPPAPSVATDYYFSSSSSNRAPAIVRAEPFQEYTAAAVAAAEEELQAGGYRYKATPRRRYDAYDNYGYLPGLASTTEDEDDLLEECLPAALLSTDCESLEDVRFLEYNSNHHPEYYDEDDEEAQLAHILDLDLPDFLRPYSSSSGGGGGSRNSHKTPPQHEYQTEHGGAAGAGASGGGDGSGGGGGRGSATAAASVNQTHRETEQQRYHHYQQQQQQHQHQQQQQYPYQQHQHQQQQQLQSQQQQAYQSYQYPSHDSCEGFNQFANDASSCLGNQRMMVSKLWNSCFPEFTPDHVHRHNFYLCQWQRNTQVRIVYLFYRWITAITCLAALVCSLLDIGRTDEHFEHHYAKWWIYLTHWGLLFCTVQAWLAAWIVTQGMMVEREDFEIVRQAKKSRLHHLYWVLYTCATVYAFIVTMCYWLLVHNPGK